MYIADEVKYSSVVRVKPSHYQYDSTTSTSEDHDDHSEPIVYAKVNRQHAAKKASGVEKTDEDDHEYSTIATVAVANSSNDDTDNDTIPEQPQASMATHSANTYNKKPPPQENVQLISMKPTSDAEVIPAAAQSFPAGSSYDMQPIHYMASVGDKKKLAQIISQLNSGSDDQAGFRGSVDVRDSEGRTPLMHAIHNEHFACVKMLMDAGADVDIVSNGLFNNMILNGDILCNVYRWEYTFASCLLHWFI